MCGVIGQHPELFGSPELNLFRARSMRKFNDLTRLHMGLHRFVAQVYAGEQTIESVEMARHWMLARLDRSTAQVHRELCEKIAPRAMVQKSPATCAAWCTWRACSTPPEGALHPSAAPSPRE